MRFHGRPAELMQACSVAANVFVYNLLLLWLYSLIIDLDRVSVIQFYDTDHARTKWNEIKSNEIKSNQISGLGPWLLSWKVNTDQTILLFGNLLDKLILKMDL